MNSKCCGALIETKREGVCTSTVCSSCGKIQPEEMDFCPVNEAQTLSKQMQANDNQKSSDSADCLQRSVRPPVRITEQFIQDTKRQWKAADKLELMASRARIPELMKCLDEATTARNAAQESYTRAYELLGKEVVESGKL